MDDTIHARIHISLPCGETISFEKFHKNTKIITIFKEILNKKSNVIKIHIYTQG